ncbi:nucleoside deaminase [Motiliproteus sp. SC1-56]|uniref:nucleoside deaminase n=1 Tax=Motiliproteus sp. SC1-56 TaxID=2799565 RepID=UPI001A8F6F65|nr:nucleoside deaminase [Motiliproteus sp. SC1-56]
MTALEQGCRGAGAILISGHGQMLLQDHDRVFLGGFHPHRHAEMGLLEQFEGRGFDLDRTGLTLMTTLEPCPMCLCRSLGHGIGHLRYLVADSEEGMAQTIEQLPPAWRELARLQTRSPADISPELRALAKDLAFAEQAQLQRRFLNHIRPDN